MKKEPYVGINLYLEINFKNPILGTVEEMEGLKKLLEEGLQPISEEIAKKYIEQLKEKKGE